MFCVRSVCEVVFVVLVLVFDLFCCLGWVVDFVFQFGDFVTCFRVALFG